MELSLGASRNKEEFDSAPENWGNSRSWGRGHGQNQGGLFCRQDLRERANDSQKTSLSVSLLDSAVSGISRTLFVVRVVFLFSSKAATPDNAMAYQAWSSTILGIWAKLSLPNVPPVGKCNLTAWRAVVANRSNSRPVGSGNDMAEARSDAKTRT